MVHEKGQNNSLDCYIHNIAIFTFHIPYSHFTFHIHTRKMQNTRQIINCSTCQRSLPCTAVENRDFIVRLNKINIKGKTHQISLTRCASCVLDKCCSYCHELVLHRQAQLNKTYFRIQGELYCKPCMKAQQKSWGKRKVEKEIETEEEKAASKKLMKQVMEQEKKRRLSQRLCKEELRRSAEEKKRAEEQKRLDDAEKKKEEERIRIELEEKRLADKKKEEERIRIELKIQEFLEKFEEDERIIVTLQVQQLVEEIPNEEEIYKRLEKLLREYRMKKLKEEERLREEERQKLKQEKKSLKQEKAKKRRLSGSASSETLQKVSKINSMDDSLVLSREKEQAISKTISQPNLASCYLPSPCAGSEHPVRLSKATYTHSYKHLGCVKKDNRCHRFRFISSS